MAVIGIPVPPLPLSSCVHNLRGGVKFVITLTRFVVSCVFNLYGSKWHASKEGNDPSWPLNMNELPKYHLSLREVFVDAQNGVELKPYIFI